MTRLMLFGFIIGMVVCSAGYGAQIIHPERGFVSTKPARNWEHALISGNGTIGALVMSRPLDETIIFNHERLFMPAYPSKPLVDMAPHLDTIRGMIDEEEYREAAQFVAEIARKQGYRGMWWTDPLIPAFDLKITMSPAGKTRDYARSVDFQTGVASGAMEGRSGCIFAAYFRFPSRQRGGAFAARRAKRSGRLPDSTGDEARKRRRGGGEPAARMAVNDKQIRGVQ